MRAAVGLMARTVDEAFELLLNWLSPSAAERAQASSHRGSLEQAIKNAYGSSSYLLQSGSYGHGTSISRFSDADYFAVVPSSSLADNSNNALQRMRTVLKDRFPSTEVTVRSPAVVVHFGTSGSERTEIIPAYNRGQHDGAPGIRNSQPIRWLDGCESARSCRLRKHTTRQA
jgi:tRNA nucleotidyltransferase (CCA-adding enzyme)